ncbi:MAG: magnesium/cobalt transporter CorA [Bdellovibrionales bacterium]|nr:magnesium/cobalt transporter CorA [Bdellovibrionales bacterium]
MARLLKTRTKVIGLHPGALVFVDESGDTETIQINLIDYNKDSIKESTSATLDECVKRAKDPSTVTWIEFQGLRDKNIIEEIGNQFGIHRLWLEDVLNMDHRPKIEEMDNMLLAIIKLANLELKKGRPRLKMSQTSLFFGKGFVLSFNDTKDDFFAPVKERIRQSVWKIRTLQADYLFYALIDFLIDQYYLVLEPMEDYFDQIEDQVTMNINKITPLDIMSLKGEFLYLRKTVFPIKEALNKVISHEHPWIEEQNIRYFQDVQDHIVQIVEVADYYNELTTSLMDFYQNTVNSKMNEVMKVLTLFASLFIPLTFIVGIYGMNFKFMPELEWKYSYPLIWVIILVISATMFLFFKRKKWL